MVFPLIALILFVIPPFSLCRAVVDVKFGAGICLCLELWLTGTDCGILV